MEIVIIVAVAIGLIGWWIWKEGKHEEAGHPLESFTKKLDINNDGKVDSKDVTAAAEVVVEEVKVVAKKTKQATTQATKKAKAKVAEVKEKATKSRKPKK